MSKLYGHDDLTKKLAISTWQKFSSIPLIYKKALIVFSTMVKLSTQILISKLILQHLHENIWKNIEDIIKMLYLYVCQ